MQQDKDTKIILNGDTLFITKTAADWLRYSKSKPTPLPLFDIFWHEGELCIFFGDTGSGKSLKAVQIADKITKGKPYPPFSTFTDPMPVLLADFELSAKQFERRYSHDYEDHYDFSDNFRRAEINPDTEMPEGKRFEDMVFPEIEKEIIESGIRILIVDNLTYLRTGTETAKDALPLMKILKALKRKYDLSVLILAHTPKRDLTRPITINDLQGSKMLINFCDSAFSIGQSVEDNSVRYIKQIKARNTEVRYDSENVILYQIKNDHNFTGFEFIDYGLELDHLKRRDNIAELRGQARELHQEGKSLRECADMMGVSHMKVQRLLKKNEECPF